MARKKKQEVEEQGESAPLWIISFADLVTLMLSFFVILSATNSGSGSGSGSEKNPAMERVAIAIRAAFSELSADESAILAANTRFEDLLRQLEGIARKGGPRSRGDSPEKGIYGEHFRVRRIRDGMEITMGGPVYFDLLSDNVNAAGKADIAQLAEKLKGHRNMLEIRGHAGDQPRPADWGFQDIVELSYRRARRVADELIRLGVDPRTIRVTAIGDNEPIARGTTEPAKLAGDRRVEVIIRESVIDDFTSQPTTQAAPTSRPVGMPSATGPVRDTASAPSSKTDLGPGPLAPAAPAPSAHH